MSSLKKKKFDYSDIIADIFREYSIADSSMGKMYLRHFGQLETKILLSRKNEFIKEAEKKGILSAEESVNILIKDEMWDLEKEKSIQEKTNFISNLKKGLSKIKLPSQMENHKNLIKKEEEILDSLNKEKKELIGITSEDFAEKKLNRLFFDKICYFDKDYQKPVSEEISYSDFSLEIEISKIQSDFFEKFTDNNISRAVLSESYGSYFPFSENVMDVFGKPLKDMTAYQIKMAGFARSFLMIFKNAQKEIPDYVARDPEALVNWNQNQNTGKNDSKTSNNEDKASAIFGATKDDIEKIKKEDEDAITLNDALKKEGGNLNMQQLMKMHDV